MKNAAHKRQIKLVEDIQANLSGLNAKYARKLEKPLVNTVRKLSRKFTKLLDKYSRVRNRKAAAPVFPAAWHGSPSQRRQTKKPAPGRSQPSASININFRRVPK